MKTLGVILIIISVLLLTIVHEILCKKGITKKEEKCYFIGFNTGFVTAGIFAIAYFLCF